jgi:hypothetical protein
MAAILIAPPTVLGRFLIENFVNPIVTSTGYFARSIASWIGTKPLAEVDLPNSRKREEECLRCRQQALISH